MSKGKRLGAMLLALLAAGTLAGAENANEVFGLENEAWTHSGKVIPSEKNGVRELAWTGTSLIFAPENGTYSLENAGFFTFLIRVPEAMQKLKFRLTFVCQDGTRKQYKLTMPDHTGYQRYRIPTVIKSAEKEGRAPILKEILLDADNPDFQAFLRDVRMVSGVIDHDFPDDRIPQVTNGCFFPENTLNSTKVEVLADPDFKAKMAEIERLRKSKLKMPLKKLQKNRFASAVSYYERIRPDGSVEGLSYADTVRNHQKTKLQCSENENYIHEHCAFASRLFRYWQDGWVPRTPENRAKLLRLMNRILSAECNRKGQSGRYVVCSFMLPQTAVQAYGIFFDEMEAVENGSCHDPELIRLNRLLKEAASWCYMEPAARSTAPCLTVNSFRFSAAWTGGNFSYRPTFLAALVCRNPRMLDVISEVAKGSLSVVSWNTKENAFWLDGMTADGSAWGHTCQNYPFGYPLNGIEGIGKLIGDLSGSRWEVKPDGPSFNHVCDYMEGLTWHGTTCADASYQKKVKASKLLQRDIPVASGRIGMQYNPGRGYADFELAVRALEEFRRHLPEGSPQKKRLDVAYDVMTGAKPLPVGLRYFWNNDLLLCRGKDSILAVAMLSSRVRSTESAPSNSHYTDFWNDGAAWIMKHFDSYRIARGFFDPCAIPGVTARQFAYEHTGSAWHTYRGGYNFAGGATDGNFAVCGFRMGRDRKHTFGHNPDPRFYDLTAQKTYFWLNGILVCLGSDIREQDPETGAEIKPLDIPIATTIDQTLWRGPASFGQGEIRKPGEKFQAESQLLWHDGVGYWILNGKGKLSGETRKGRFAEFDRANRKIKNLPKTAPILMFQIDHGTKVANSSYAYAVDFHCPSFAALKKRAGKPSFEIVSATSDAHVIRENKSGTLAAVFFKPGEAGGLKVDVPSVVLLRQTPDGKIRVTVNDPEQDPKRDSVTLGWNGKNYKVRLPTGTYFGQPVTVDLSKHNPQDQETLSIVKKTKKDAKKDNSHLTKPDIERK